jgi:hypothetical protein
MWQLQVRWFIYFYFLADNCYQMPYFCSVKNLTRIGIVLIITIGMTVISNDVTAQCPMCKMSAESNLKNGGTTARGLNAGILYMLALPYTLVGTIGFIWWRNNRRKEEDGEDMLQQ